MDMEIGSPIRGKVKSQSGNTIFTFVCLCVSVYV